jgi:hypothetical protein
MHYPKFGRKIESTNRPRTSNLSNCSPKSNQPNSTNKPQHKRTRNSDLGSLTGTYRRLVTAGSMPPLAPLHPEPPLAGVHLNRTTLLSREAGPPQPDPAPLTPARGTHALRHFRTGPLKEAALLPMGPYRVDERLMRGATVSILAARARLTDAAAAAAGSYGEAERRGGEASGAHRGVALVAVWRIKYQ